MLIGELAEKTGLSRDTIRYYEKLGILKIARKDRLPNSYKDYPADTAVRLLRVKKLKGVGFTLNEIIGLLALFDRQQATCEFLTKKGEGKIAELDHKIAELVQLRDALHGELQGCEGNCFGIMRPECFG
jgi:DNA-binding transcriptional MerR regulator